ncbi:integrase [Paenibacillus sp. BIHB 4019]|uniref:Integrase n=1 Tax=Paenibacillus sp. BIHB 4019 TaxID=1870819 RepID=A0A1B2DPW1_9BACL|nr:tyrosine-type recombinase/integrase [Paenibacillus sp. BIHB 4019]ANY69747.1 integrase [Paenibacillus sp. BIHB 4019]
MASYQKRGESSWYMYVEAGTDAAGNRIRKTQTIRIDDPAILKSAKKTKAYLDEELLKFKMLVESGEYINPDKMKFSAFVELWKTRFVEKNLEETTAFNYKYHSNKWIIPHFGEKSIDKIKTMHIVDFLDGLTDVTGSATRVYIFRVLRSIFTKATEWKVIKQNPMQGVTKPKDEPKSMEVYSEEEVGVLLTALQKEPIRLRVMITLALTTGMRRAELLGLEWKHIDLENSIIDVKQTIPIFKDGEPVIKGPKKKSSIRKIVFPSSVSAELKLYQTHMMRERSNTEAPWEGGEYYFLFAHENGRPFYPKTLYDQWRDFLKRVPNLKQIRLHDLRHTSATLLINQGVHAKIISNRLGHAKISTTMNVYGHVIESADRAAAETFNNLFEPKKPLKKKKS